jgi:hypothetical protein
MESTNKLDNSKRWGRTENSDWIINHLPIINSNINKVNININKVKHNIDQIKQSWYIYIILRREVDYYQLSSTGNLSGMRQTLAYRQAKLRSVPNRIGGAVQFLQILPVTAGTAGIHRSLYKMSG